MGKGVGAAVIAIDFFCGGGGLTKGLSSAGIKVLGGYDNCQEYKETYEANNYGKFVCKDIRMICGEDIYADFPEIAENEGSLLLSGCAPCQPFSKHQHSIKEHTDSDLLSEFGRIVIEIKPAHIIVENVPGLRKKGKDVLLSFLEMLATNDYSYAYRVVNAKDFGVPQNRKRLVILASRLFKPIMPDGSHGQNKKAYVNVQEAIGKYPPIEAGSGCESVPNHFASSLSELNIKRISATPISGGDRRSWSNDLVLECHKNGHTGHTDVYGRMDWEKVSPTLTSKCFSLSNGRYGHPEQNRAISLREAAAIQSFPDDYVFYGTMISIGKQIGNAVPVRLAKELADYIVRMAVNCKLEE